VVLFFLGYPVIVSVWTLTVLPITLLVYGGLRTYQTRHVFGSLNLVARRNRFGYVAFLLGYQVLCSTASLAGYAQHIVGAQRRWN
jgi:biofilm PGA synthesis N-glycosyltransferase PgaC